MHVYKYKYATKYLSIANIAMSIALLSYMYLNTSVNSNVYQCKSQGAAGWFMDCQCQ